jgi:hypothetical protein
MGHKPARFAAEVQASRLWLSAFIVGLVLSQGVAPQLRGAAVGLERWIDATDLVAASITQIVGVTGSLLIVRLLVEALRDVPRRPSSALVAALGFLPGFVVLLAAEGAVFGPLQNVSGLSVVALGTLVALTRLFAAPRAAILPTLAVVSYACRLLLTFESPDLRSPRHIVWLGAIATLLTLAFVLGLALRPKAPTVRIRPRETATRMAPGPAFINGSVWLGYAHFLITAVVDPTWTALFSTYPFAAGALAIALPLSAYLIWFPTPAYKRTGTVLLLLPCVLPLSPLSLAAATLGFLLMHLTETPSKYSTILAA